MELHLCFFPDLWRSYSGEQNIDIHQRDSVSISVNTVYQHDIYLFAFFFLPFSLCLLCHLDWVPDQDSGAGTWPWVYLSCTKSWSSPDLPYRQLHQKGVDRMCSCCHRKGKMAFLVTSQCLSTHLPVGVNQSDWIQEAFF